ncbi:MAG: hypothetical protein K2W95_33805 [Candidatus Obscuribacterales bacterium]|nr:hypothetical protein [Candidatus Obscuribacterales bacterium]
MTRTEHGATLGFTLVTTMVMISIGFAAFYLSKLLGGHRELSHAADAGTLAVSKDGVQYPHVKTNSTPTQRSPLDGLVDHSVKGFNLHTYNRAVGQAFLVALNAEAEGDRSPEGIRNARMLISTLQGSNGLGAKLSDKLAKPGEGKDSWVAASFMPPASSNSLRMLAHFDSTPKLDYSVSPGNYSVSYVRPGDAELSTSNTNIELGKNFSNQLPLIDYNADKRVRVPSNAIAEDKTRNYKSLRGYDPIKVGRVGTVCAVTMSPYEQPHLVSNRYFERNLVNPASAAGLVIPPNAFQTVVSTVDKRTALELNMKTSSVVGTEAINIPLDSSAPNTEHLSASLSKYDLAIPRGYLVIDNEGDGKDSAFSGLLPQPNTRSEPWYHTTGVSVDERSGCFSNNGQLEKWMQYNYQTQKLGLTGLTPPSLDGVYTRKGEPAGLIEAKLIAPQMNPAPCLCNDRNSDLSGMSPNLTCALYAASPFPVRGAFDKAYHPEYMNPPVYGKSPIQLTAGELAKLDLCKNYVTTMVLGKKVMAIDRVTGARLYPQDRFQPPLKCAPIPYNVDPSNPSAMGPNVNPAAMAYSDPVVPGKVSKEGSILALTAQASKLAILPMKRFLENRMWQMKPDATQLEIDAVVSLVPIELRAKYFLYLDKNRQFQLSKTPPFWVDVRDSAQLTPDGEPRHFVTGYDLRDTLVNSNADFNIHIKPYLDDTKAFIWGEVGAHFTPSSGANNLLGVIKFTESAKGGGLFSDAN